MDRFINHLPMVKKTKAQNWSRTETCSSKSGSRSQSAELARDFQTGPCGSGGTAGSLSTAQSCPQPWGECTFPVQPPSPFPSHTDPLVPGWQVIYFQTHTDTSLFLRQRGREGVSLRHWALIMVWLLPTAPGPPVSITCSEALALLCSLHSGTSLSSPLADIFIQSVRLPPTHTPTQHSYGKNTARL